MQEWELASILQYEYARSSTRLRGHIEDWHRQPFVAAPLQARYDLLIDSYNAVRDHRIIHPETIREIARRFFEIEKDPEANKYFPYDAGKAASILLRQAKLYEDRARVRKHQEVRQFGSR